MKTPGNEPDIVHMPPDLLAQARRAADEEQRTADDLVRDAVERYLKDRSWQRLIAYGHEQARKLGLTEEDVPRLIAEYRQEKRQGL
jgi:hypothetical protein